MSKGTNIAEMAPKLAANEDPGIVKGFAQRVLHLIDRARYSSLLGQSFGGKRDLYTSFGYDKAIEWRQIWEMYNRGGVARRIATAIPDSVWGRPPELYIEGNPAWNTEWAAFAQRTSLWQAMHRLDIMLNLGRFGVMLIGTDKVNLEMPVNKVGKITFFQPFAEKDIKVQQWDTNPNSATFGMPLMYMVYPAITVNNDTRDANTTVMPRTAFKVHASRIIHAARDPLENKIFGIPIYAPIWNYLTDLMKVVGSSAESYWKQAYPGIHANVDKDMDLAADDEANLTAEIDEYEHQFRRFIRTRGVDVKAIGGQVADPRGAFDVLLTLISGTTGIPKRILLGSEAGQLASTQDKGTWAERIEENRSLHAEPNLIQPLIWWMVNHGLIPADIPVDTIQILWPDAYRMSPLERGQTSAQTARTLANIQKGLQPIILTPEVPATPATTGPNGETIPGQPGIPGTTAEPLLSRDEARRLLGLSTDQNMLDATPA